MGNGLLRRMAGGALQGVGQQMVRNGVELQKLRYAELDRQWKTAENEEDRGIRRTGLLMRAEDQRARRVNETKTLEAGTARDVATAEARVQAAADRHEQAVKTQDWRTAETEARNARDEARTALANARDAESKRRYEVTIAKMEEARAESKRRFEVSEKGRDQRHEESMAAVAGRLVEVGDPKSPTGTTYMPRSQAANLPGKAGAKAAAEASRSEDDRRRRDAKDQAVAEAADKGGFSGPWDESDFPEDGTREGFVNRRIREILSKDSGGGGTREASVPYRGDKPPPGHPEAKRAKDGFWYVQRGEKWQRVTQGNPMAGVPGAVDNRFPQR